MKKSKILYVVRHAKSLWDDDDIADIDRPIKSKGIRKACETAGELKKNRQIPEIIISSPAIRALHTALIFARVLEIPPGKIEINDALYHASANQIINLVRNLGDEHNSVMIFGHNPEFTEIANYFVEPPVDNIPTSGVVELIFSTAAWKTIDRGNLEGQFFFFLARDE
jgi:phosphohistidine phosphatase